MTTNTLVYVGFGLLPHSSNDPVRTLFVDNYAILNCGLICDPCRHFSDVSFKLTTLSGLHNVLQMSLQFPHTHLLNKISAVTDVVFSRYGYVSIF